MVEMEIQVPYLLCCTVLPACVAGAGSSVLVTACQARVIVVVGFILY